MKRIIISLIICLLLLSNKNNAILYSTESKIYASGNINLNENTGFRIEDNYLIGIEDESEVSSFDLGLDLKYKTSIINSKGKKTTGYIFTGDQVQARYNNESLTATVIIKGDINGDGKVSAQDYVKIRKHLMETSLINGEAFTKAADYSSDNTISSKDYVLIRKYIMQKEDNEYTITFNSNGGSGTMNPQRVKNYRNYNLLRNKLEKEGSTFVGWNTASDGSGTEYKDLSKIKVSNNTTLYAIWKLKIQFYSNGGTGNMPDQYVKSGTSTQLNQNLYTRTGYKFIGWNTKSNGKGQSYNNKANINITKNTPLYAQWELNISNFSESVSYEKTYNLVDYIRAENGAYIDLGYVPNSKTKILIDFQLLENNIDYSKLGEIGALAVFGAKDSESSRLQIYSLTPNKIAIGFGDNINKFNVNFNRNVYVFDVPNKKVTINSNTDYNIQSITFGSRSIYLFRSNTNSSNDQIDNTTKIYGFKIYEDDTLICDLKPVYNVNDEEYGFYDVIKGIYYKNANSSGTLTSNSTSTNLGSITDSSNSNVVLVAPTDVNLTVTNGYNGNGYTLYPVKTLNSTLNIYYYKLAKGEYKFHSYGTGYYDLNKSFAIDNENTIKIIDADPGKSKNNGWETSHMIDDDSDEIVDALAFNNTLINNYRHLLVTPSFSTSKYNNEFTNLEDIESFIGNMNRNDDNLYVFSVGKTIDNLNMPLVIYTKSDISECEDKEDKDLALKCAANIINNNGKITIGYTAQIHGNEPAATEGALLMIQSLHGSYGDSILQKANIYIIPQYNVDGSRVDTRKNFNSVDMNRDQLYASQVEVQQVHKIYNLFLPHAVVDAHEETYTHRLERDVDIGIAHSNNTPESLNELSRELYASLMTRVKNAGIYPAVYGSYPNNANNSISRIYHGLYGSISLLVETPGIGCGKSLWANRVLSQYITIKQYFDYLTENSTTVKSTVNEARQAIKNYVTYDSNNLLTLRHTQTDNSNYQSITYETKYSDYTLSPGRQITKKWLNNTKVSRSRPTAYVISKNITKTIDNKQVDVSQTVINILNANGISCYEINSETNLMLRQYNGDSDGATLENKAEKRFTSGAYVCTMNQIGGNILAMTMEPDVLDTKGYNATFVQGGLLNASEIYRSEENLVSSSDSDAINGKKVPTLQ